LIKALGPFLTGFSPFFHAVNHAKNFAEGINILSNPFEKGFEAVAPDTTLRQLEHLDEQALRDSVTFKNDDQVPIVVFFEKDSFDFAIPKEDRNKPSNILEDLKKAGATVVFQGSKIAYLNRVRVVARPAPPPVRLEPTVSESNLTEVEQGKAETISISGSSLDGASLAGPPGFTFKDARVDPNGRVLMAKVEVEDTVQPGDYTFFVTTPSGKQERTLRVTAAPLTVSSEEVAYDDNNNPPKAGTDQPNVRITINGRHLQGTRLEVTDDAAKAKLQVKASSVTDDGLKLQATIMVSKDTPEGSYKLRVVDSFGRDSKEVSFKVAK
jgi:hypothetical protein